MSVKSVTIKKRAMFADIHQDTRGSTVHSFAIKYRKKDGTVGFKANVSKSLSHLPHEKKYKQNVSINHVLLLHDNEAKRPFEILIDLMIEYNYMLIDHTI